MARKPVELGEGELAVMRVLWDDGPLTVRDVMERLHERGKTVAYTTVMTFLARLEQKGVVTSNKRDTAYIYRAKITRESVSASRIRTLLDQFYDGAAVPMLLHLIENEQLSPSDLAMLRKLIDDLDSHDRA